MTVIINGSTGITLPDGSNFTTSLLYINNQTISSNVTLTANTSASATGPISLANNVVVTMPVGTRWVIL
jgi:hypothetical protein